MSNHTSTSDDREYFASCLAGLEHLLSEELRALGARRVRPLSSGVAFFGGEREALRACLWSRLASRITLVAGRVGARDADELYAGAAALPWGELIRRGASLAVRARGANERLRNTTFTALKVKDAVVDALRGAWGERPSVNADDPDAVVEVTLRGDKATISLDLAGSSLYRRTYLEDEARAPLSQAVAVSAGLLALAGWDAAARDGARLVDPQCADGVLACEAALIAADAAPGLARGRWGFEGLAPFDSAMWDELVAEADDRLEAGLEAVASHAGRHPVIGAVSSQRRLAAVRGRLARAGAASLAELFLADEEGAAASERIASASRALHGAPLVVASALPAPESFSTAANAHAAYAAFLRCVASCSGACVVGVAGGGALIDAALPVEPAETLEAGRERFAQRLRVFRGVDLRLRTISVPDATGGAERRIVVLDEHADQFAARLRKNLKERRKWAARSEVSCYRLYDADLPDFSVAIDVYQGVHEGEEGSFLHIAEYAPPASIDQERAWRRFEDILALAPAVCGVAPAHTFSKVRRRDKGGSQYRSEHRQPFVAEVEEYGLRFEVDLNGYLDTGLFLDHRETRILVGSMASGARFLNLFAYTGSASVHAAAGGARSTLTVDLSQTYLDWAQRNMALNGFDGPEDRFERADAMTWVSQARRAGRRFDLVFVDPPTFSNSKSMGKRTWDVQRDHAELLIGVSRLLSEEGVAVFSCNLRSFKPDVEKLERYGVEIEDVTAETIPHDFERNPRIHRCYLVRRKRS